MALFDKFSTGSRKTTEQPYLSSIVEKQRNGPTGDVELHWERDYTRFSNRAPERYSEFDDFPSPL